VTGGERKLPAALWSDEVNEGSTECPPPPCRCCALVATWHTRRPGLPVPVMDALLDSLGGPPAFRTSTGRAGPWMTAGG
jgi:hypothetical protein